MKFNSLKKIFLEEFSSLKLAITLFVFLAITTLIGTVLPEEPMVGHAELIKKYGEQKYLFLKGMGLTDVFHSWWYLALLTTLGVNLIVVSFRRVFPKARKAFLWTGPVDGENIKKLPVNCELETSSNLSLSFLEQKLKKRNYSTKTIDGKLLAMKGAWHRLGASVSHVGILTLLTGCTITILTGFNGMTQISENEGFYLADLGTSNTQIKSIEPENWLAPISKMPVWLGRIPLYLVKVNKTWREDYESGQPKQWFSELSVYDENKKELTRKTIHVNDPLEFMGLDIYQSNWGKFASIVFNNEQATIPVENVNGEEVIFLPLSEDIALKLKILQNNISSASSDVLELYSIYSGEKTIEKYIGKVEKNKTFQLGPINIGYGGTQTLTGLQFKSNPGGILIYPGLFFLICGVFIAFGSKKQIWAAISETNNKIVIGGNSDRAMGNFVKEFENMISELTEMKK